MVRAQITSSDPYLPKSTSVPYGQTVVTCITRLVFTRTKVSAVTCTTAGCDLAHKVHSASLAVAFPRTSKQTQAAVGRHVTTYCCCNIAIFLMTGSALKAPTGCCDRCRNKEKKPEHEVLSRSSFLFVSDSLRLLAPSRNARKLLFRPCSTCRSSEWLDRASGSPELSGTTRAHRPLRASSPSRG